MFDQNSTNKISKQSLNMIFPHYAPFFLPRTTNEPIDILKFLQNSKIILIRNDPHKLFSLLDLIKTESVSLNRRKKKSQLGNFFCVLILNLNINPNKIK